MMYFCHFYARTYCLGLFTTFQIIDYVLILAKLSNGFDNAKVPHWALNYGIGLWHLKDKHEPTRCVAIYTQGQNRARNMVNNLFS